MNQNSGTQTAVATAKMKQTTTSMLLVCGTQILLMPSKANHRSHNQFDPPSCSTCFNSEAERVDYILSLLKPEKYSKKDFKENFYLVSEPIKFFQRDEPCDKLFTGYLVLLKKQKIIKNFLINEGEQWIEMGSVMAGSAPFYVSPLFTRAVNTLNSEMSGLLNKRERFF